VGKSKRYWAILMLFNGFGLIFFGKRGMKATSRGQQAGQY